MSKSYSDKDLDRIDKKLLSLIQKDATISVAELAESVNLSTTPCWKRLKKMENEGVITNRVTLLDPYKLDLSFTAFVQIRTSNHSRQWATSFVKKVSEFTEVMEFYRMAGDYDYMMKVQVRDMKAFDDFYKTLVSRVSDLTKVTSTFAMEQLKYTTALPL